MSDMYPFCGSEVNLGISQETVIKELGYDSEPTPKRYYLDCEFIDDGSTIDLISIGIVCEDGRDLYLQSCEFASENASDWVSANIYTTLSSCSNIGKTKIIGSGRTMWSKGNHRDFLPNPCPLPDCPWRTREQIRDEIIQFLGVESFDLFGWCSGYDFVAFTQLFGTMMHLPAFYPHYIRDLQQVLDEYGIADSDLPQQEKGLHNALSDALHIRKLWEHVEHHTSELTAPNVHLKLF